MDELSTRTGHTFHLRGEPSIPAFEQAIARSDYDFVYMNPWHAVIAIKLLYTIPRQNDILNESLTATSQQPIFQILVIVATLATVIWLTV